MEVDVRCSCAVAESVTVVGAAAGGAPDAVTVDGTVRVRLSGRLRGAATGADSPTSLTQVRLALPFAFPAPLAALTCNGSALPLPSAASGSPASPSNPAVAHVPIALPLSTLLAASGDASEGAEACVVAYRFAEGAVRPPVVKVQALGKAVFAPPPPPVAAIAGEGVKVQRALDVVVKLALHASIHNTAVTAAAVIVAVPPPLSPASNPAAYGPPPPAASGAPPPTPALVDGQVLAKPAAAWTASTRPPALTWSLLPAGAPLPAGVPEDNAPRMAAFLHPGAPSEMKARVLVAGGVTLLPGAPPAAADPPPTVLPVQARLTLRVPADGAGSRGPGLAVPRIAAGLGAGSVLADAVAEEGAGKEQRPVVVRLAEAAVVTGETAFKALWR
jgi:hypothetical protein